MKEPVPRSQKYSKEKRQPMARTVGTPFLHLLYLEGMV